MESGSAPASLKFLSSLGFRHHKMKIARIASRYISSNPIVEEGLAMDIVNYSKLARIIASEEGIPDSRIDAVIVACRRLASGIRGRKDVSGISLLKKSRKSISIANSKASITFTVSEKHLPCILEVMK